MYMRAFMKVCIPCLGESKWHCCGVIIWAAAMFHGLYMGKLDPIMLIF